MNDTMQTLRFVTITGADDSIDPAELVQLSKQYPFVEWALLSSAKQIGKARFPSLQWLNNLTVDARDINMNFSLHLCGYYVRQLLMGNDKFTRELGHEVWRLFRRVQINTHGDGHDWNLPALADYIKSNSSKEFIFQIDGNGKNEAMAKCLFFDYNVNNVSYLIDGSHGAGILRSSWPMPPLSKVSTGYAGGLGPDNLEAEVAKISQSIAARTDFGADWWVDMETQVRSDFDRQFDLAKVRRVLEIANPWFDGEE